MFMLRRVSKIKIKAYVLTTPIKRDKQKAVSARSAGDAMCHFFLLFFLEKK